MNVNVITELAYEAKQLYPFNLADFTKTQGMSVFLCKIIFCHAMKLSPLFSYLIIAPAEIEDAEGFSFAVSDSKPSVDALFRRRKEVSHRTRASLCRNVAFSH